jgi:hypothetical protein
MAVRADTTSATDVMLITFEHTRGAAVQASKSSYVGIRMVLYLYHRPEAGTLSMKCRRVPK